MAEQLIQQFLIIKISAFQLYLLWFLLGSFTVATLSDLKYLSAQKEFLEIWILFTLVMLATDFYNYYYLEPNTVYLILKWGLIFIFLPFYFHFIRRIAWGDISAKMAACSLFPPFLIVVFIILIRIIESITKVFWIRWRRGNYYPFMPVIFLTTLILIAATIFISRYFSAF